MKFENILLIFLFFEIVMSIWRERENSVVIVGNNNTCYKSANIKKEPIKNINLNVNHTVPIENIIKSDSNDI